MFQTLAEADRGCIVELRPGAINIGPGAFQIAFLHRFELFFCRASKSFFDQSHHIKKRFRAIIAKIIALMRDLETELIGWTLERCNRAGYDIINIREIAAHLTVIEDPDGLAFGDLLGEDPIGHV